MKENKIQSVVFDLDGVITDTAKYHYLAWKKLADELGIAIDEKFNEQLKGVSRLDSLELILQKGNLQEQFTMVEKEELASKKNVIYLEYIKELTPEDILPGILELIDDLKSEGIKMGLASVSKNADTVLKALKLDHLFDYVADAALISKSKPDPEIFLTVCHALKANPEKSIGIEDAAVGITAIKSSNMFSVGVGKSLTAADYKVDKTEQLQWEDIKENYHQWVEIEV